MIVLASTLAAAAAAAQERGSAADQVACTPDVLKLCSALIPDEGAIIGCLREKREPLSPACSKVFLPALRRRNHQR